MALLAPLSMRSQNATLSIDTILHYFRTSTAVEAYYKMQETELSLNYKFLYYNDSVKKYMLKLFDVKMYQEYEIRKEKEKVERNVTFVNVLVKDLVQNKNFYDSIVADTSRYRIYADSAINENIASYREQVERNTLYPFTSVLEMLVCIPYPEVYTHLKRYWKESGKEEYRRLLILLGDPEAQQSFDKEVALFVKTKGKSIDGLTMLREIESVSSTSYGLRKMIEVLPITVMIEPISDFETQFNCEALSSLITRVNYYQDWSGVDLTKGLSLPRSYDDCDDLLKGRDNVIKATQELMKVYDKEQAYWRVNMPYNKK